ncbi:MAG: hypothetical protein RSC68_13900, partial [Acinetobacter sp.]
VSLYGNLTVCPAAKVCQPFDDNPVLAAMYCPNHMFSLPLTVNLPAAEADNAAWLAQANSELTNISDVLQNIGNDLILDSQGRMAVDFLRSKISAKQQDASQSLEIANVMAVNQAALRDAHEHIRSLLTDKVMRNIKRDQFKDMCCTRANSDYVLPLNATFFTEWDNSTGNQPQRQLLINFLTSFKFDRDNNDPNWVTVSCQYNQTTFSQLMVLETKKCAPAMIWPPKPCDQWPEYYFYSDLDGILINDIMAESSMKLLVHGKTPCTNRQKIISGDVRGEVTGLNEFPDLFEVHGVDALQHDTLLGCIYINKPASLTVGIGSTAVGIDFGSTNTTVYYMNGNNPLPLRLSAGNYTVVGQADAVKTLLNFHFDVNNNEDIPENNEDIPEIFMTLLNDHRQNMKIAHEALATCSIPFTRTLTPDTSQPQFKRLRSELKFNKAGALPPAVALNCQAFLTQLVSEIRWSLLQNGIDSSNPANVRYYYAVPSSMSNAARGNINTILNAVLQNYDATFQNGQHDMYESEAVGAFVTKRLFPGAANAQSGYACIDIGGGSIDISTWQQADAEAPCSLIGETSLNEIAGKGLLTWMMRCMRDGMGTLLIDAFNTYQVALTGAGVNADMEQYLQKMNQSANAGDINQFSTYYGARAEQLALVIKQAAIHNLAAEDNQIKRCQNGINLYFGMVLFFVGQMVGAAILSGAMLPWPKTDFQKFTLFLAGNGSKFINTTGDLAQNPALQQTLINCFIGGVESFGITEHGDVVITDSGIYHKSEVAGGLCYQFGTLNAPPIVALNAGLPATPAGLAGTALNFNADTFLESFGQVKQGEDPNNSFDVCAHTDLLAGNYDERFRDMLLKVLTVCDLQ